MITLNTEKGLVRIESWDDIISRPGFVPKLDPAGAELEAIIATYNLPNKVNCGFPCNQPHNKGYVIATKDGRETNIGHDCGKAHFSVEFDEIRRIYERDFRNKERREQLETLQLRIPSYLNQIEAMRAGPTGADSTYRLIQSLKTHGRGLPSILVEEIAKLVKARSGQIAILRQATESEIEDLEAIRGTKIKRPHYFEMKVGYIQGISALYPEHDLRKILILDIIERLRFIHPLDISSLDEKKLREHSKWGAQLDTKLELVEQILISADTLLSSSNLAQLGALLTRNDEKGMFAKFLAQLESEVQSAATTI